MGSSHSRTERVGDQIQRELAEVLQFEMKDPRVGMVTLNEVRVSRDLAYSDIYFTVLADDEADAHAAEAEKVLTHAAGYLRTALASRMNLRMVPRLRFHYDSSVQRGRKLSSLIDSAVRSDQDRQKARGEDQE